MKRRAIEYIVGLKEDIDNIFSEKHSLPIVEYYSNKFDIPLDISSLYIKQRISRCFIMKSNKFDRKLDNAYIIVSIIKYLSFLIYTLLLSSRRNTIEPNNSELLIEGVQSKSEIDRWLKLESEFNIGNTIFLARNDMDSVIKSKHNIFVYKTMRNYERKILIQLLFKSFFYDIFFLVKNSFNLGINLIHIHTLYVNDYLYYSNVFRECRAKFMIQDRNLGMTNALKNYLFKKSGGLFSTCTQKNIVQHNANNLFFDADIFFTLGKKTAEDLPKLGGRIGSVFPVGSLTMDSVKDLNSMKEKNIDILYIGINAVNVVREDYKGYYESIKWLANLSIKFPKLEIFIKHHPSCRDDPIEVEITNNTNIKYINKTLNSYQLSFQSNLIITYGSTMGYELIGCGLKVLFFDPDKKNPFLISSLSSSKNTFYDYNTAEQTLRNIEEIATIKNKTDYCLCNTDVSRSIYQHLLKQESK
jgi:hypothetical protein